MDNTFNFLFSRDALVRLLTDTGFTCVMEVHSPLEIGKRADRVTMVATKGKKIRLSVYPWVNDKSEAQIIEALKGLPRPTPRCAGRRSTEKTTRRQRRREICVPQARV